MAPFQERDIIIEDPTLAGGFTVMPNLVIRREDLSTGAKLTYVALLTYAWQDGACFPGQERLARDVSVSDRSIRTYLKELVSAGLISIKQRGLNQTNIYILHRLPPLGPENASGPDRQQSTGPESVSDQDRKATAGQDRKGFPRTNTQTDNHQKTIETSPAETHLDTITPFPIPELGLNSAQVWHALIDAAETRAAFSRSEIDTWLRPAELIGRDGDALLIAAPNAVARDRLDTRMLPRLRAVAAARFGVPVAMRVVVR